MTHPEHTPASSDSSRRRPLAPDTRRLDDRSARAWTEPMAVRPLGSGRYAVDSSSGATYVVDLPRGDCSCPDHEIRGERCKHLRRVALEVTERRVPAPGKRRADCAVCGHESFVPESGAAVCGDCWLERGDIATDRETGDTVVVYRLTDERADERYIDAAGCTVAEYPKNEGYPPDDPVVEVVYPFSGDADSGLDERPRYAFPYARLAVREEMLVE
ncbi:SWIM zinc finger family protein [Natronomonas sp. CBA1123]|uniref:SWIM zinc finger family protein n=1 Tax=Natronomonas sp. CBA1123 TaxID=2668070 RepID=UPI0012E9B157|nr:SWIM zinc finger family protein [Natronomonas sp. CBA1123]